jgi:single-stranded-DNA-specific exonuclease
MNKKTIEDLKMLEPFGEGNRNPIFMYKNLKIESIRSLSEGKHLKLTLKDGSNSISGIAFGMGNLSEEYQIDDKIDIVGNLEINVYNNIETIQMNIKDIMKSYK